jgi:hypothetical protein
VNDSPVIDHLDNTLSNVFDTPRMELTQVLDSKGVVPVDNESDTEVDTDHTMVRSNMYNLIESGKTALDYAIDIAKQTDSPRGFEVVSTIMKQLADMNMQLMDLHDKTKKLKGRKTDAVEPSKVINNSIVFSGTTNDINKMIEQLKSKNGN